MKATILFIQLLSLCYTIMANYNYYNCNSIRIRNTGLRMIIFKEKKLPKIVQKIRNFYEICYYKSIASFGEGIQDYNNLSEEERSLIESIISLCY